MPKEALKRAVASEQDNLCDLTGLELPDDTALYDTDRKTPKLDGGTYDDRPNVRVVDPVAHMQRHGIWRERETPLENIKALVDDREQTMKLHLKVQNQLRAYDRRTDHENEETRAFLDSTLASIESRRKAIEALLVRAVRDYDNPLVKSALGVTGMAEMTVAGLVAYVDLEKAPQVSSLWCYVGLHRPSHRRYEKDAEQAARRKARGAEWYGSTDAVPTGWGGNKTLRTILYRGAESMMRNRDCPYRLVYERVKDRLGASERVVSSRNTAGQLVEVAWKDTKPSHRHGAALRAIMKHVLADWWYVGRTLAGLPTRPLYVAEQLGHSGIVSPEERGWKF